MPKIAIVFAIRATLVATIALACAAHAASRTAPETDGALALALRAERARPAAARFPRAAFLVQASVAAAALSPDGRHVAWLKTAGGHREAWARPTAGGAARRLAARTEAQHLLWTRDGRWLLLESPRQLFAVAMAGQPGSGIVATLGGREERTLQGVDGSQDAAVVAVETVARAADGRPSAWRLVRIDMRGRARALHRDTRRIVGQAIDARGRLAFVQRLEGAALSIRRVERDGRLTEIARCERLHRCTPLGTSPDGDALWLRADIGEDAGPQLSRLLRVDADGRMRTVHADPRGEADLDRLVFDPATRQPLIAGYGSTVAMQYGLDADTQRHVERLQARFPRRGLRIEVGRGHGAHWLVATTAGHQQGTRWHVYDPRTGDTRPLFDDAPVHARDARRAAHLPEGALAGKHPVTWRASDGMRLHGFVHVPPGRDPAALPLVAMPHGGPWNHSRPAYNGFAQFLVNRGYAVFEPNFRASSGHGRRYMFAANGDFGDGRVQRDIVEGTRHLLANGIGDPRRVGIVGASFGGYSAALGVTFQPDLFKVGVAFVPPPDFAWTLRWVLRNPEALELERVVPMADWLRTLSLDTADRATMARLHAQSPLANAARMDRPLLLIAGGEDRRVGIAGVVEYAARLKRAGKPVSLMIDEDAGHGTRDPIAREANLYALEAMLHRHLGGAAPDAPDPVLGAYLRRTLRICGRDMRAVCARAAR